MSVIARAAALYFALVFALGFLLGTLRVLVLIPRLGELASVLVELPIMLTVSWLLCRRVIHRLAVPARPGPRLLMGAMAFSFLMVAELGLSVFVFDRSLPDYLAALTELEGAIGLAGQVMFAAFPVLQMRA